jgi:glycosyltransferase involved in cell wall biosynthesis
MSAPVVAVDAHNLARVRSGVEVYLDNILRHLDAPGLDFRLLTDLPPRIAPPQPYEVIPLPFTSARTGKNLMAPLWFHWTLVRAMERRGAELLWSPYFFVPLRGKIPTVATVHDTNPLDIRARSHPPVWKRYFITMLAHSARHARHIIVPSSRIADNLTRFFGTPAARMSVVPHGVADEFSAPVDEAQVAALRERLGITGRFILFVGSLNDRKNAITLLRAYAALPAEMREEWQLVIVGPGGSDEELVRAFVREQGLAGRALLAGYVEPGPLAELYKVADVFALPSLCESFGLPIIEAMAAGVPVLTTNVTSIPEVAGDAALLLPPTDVAAWTQALRRVLTEEALRRDLRARGYARARLYSWPESARRHVEIFEACL